MAGRNAESRPVTEPAAADSGRGGAPAWPPESERILEEWHRRATSARAAHYTLAGRIRRRNLVIGVPAVVLSALVGNSLFATFARDDKVSRTLGLTIGR